MKRPPDVSIFPRGTHHVSNASSLRFHMAGNGKEKLQRLSFFTDFSETIATPFDLRNISEPRFLLIGLHSEAGVEAVAP